MRRDGKAEILFYNAASSVTLIEVPSSHQGDQPTLPDLGSRP
jgi:hypothetical protein